MPTNDTTNAIMFSSVLRRYCEENKISCDYWQDVKFDCDTGMINIRIECNKQNKKFFEELVPLIYDAPCSLNLRIIKKK